MYILNLSISTGSRLSHLSYHRTFPINLDSFAVVLVAGIISKHNWGENVVRDVANLPVAVLNLPPFLAVVQYLMTNKKRHSQQS